jgi:hypothetical protein
VVEIFRLIISSVGGLVSSFVSRFFFAPPFCSIFRLDRAFSTDDHGPISGKQLGEPFCGSGLSAIRIKGMIGHKKIESRKVVWREKCRIEPIALM